MFVARISFPVIEPSALDLAAAEWVVASWHRNGQLPATGWRTYRGEDQVYVIALVSEPNALSGDHGDENVRQQLARLEAGGLGQPSVEILGEDLTAEPTCSCSDITSLILFTTFLDESGPLRCGRCFRHFPLHRLPSAEREGTLYWTSAYRACDTLYMGSGVGERFALRQLSQPDSALSRLGSELARGIRERLAIPTYYYLGHWSGRSMSSEERRPCPTCGGDWRLPEPWHRLFDFRCDKCFWVSNISFDWR